MLTRQLNFKVKEKSLGWEIQLVSGSVGKGIQIQLVKYLPQKLASL